MPTKKITEQDKIEANNAIEKAKETQKNSNSSLWTFTYLASIWAMLNGISATFRQLNTIHSSEKSRSIVKDRFVAMMVSLSFLMVLFLSPVLGIIGGLALNYFEFIIGDNLFNLVLVTSVRYLLLIAISIGFFINLYFWGPIKKIKFKQVIPGSFFASFLFIFSTESFSAYLKTVANYSATYGSASVVVSLILWLYLVGLTVLLGAELNEVLIKNKLI